MGGLTDHIQRESDCVGLHHHVNPRAMPTLTLLHRLTRTSTPQCQGMVYPSLQEAADRPHPVVQAPVRPVRNRTWWTQRSQRQETIWNGTPRFLITLNFHRCYPNHFPSGGQGPKSEGATLVARINYHCIFNCGKTVLVRVVEEVTLCRSFFLPSLIKIVRLRNRR